MNLRAALEHTLLRADARPSDVDDLCRQVLEFELLGACVNPLFVPRAVGLLGGRARVISVVGFPLGANSEIADVVQARWLVEQGAHEIDMVIPVGLALAGELGAVTERVRAVRAVTREVILKVILETGYFEAEELKAVSLAVLEAEPDFLKTSTGMGPRGASVEDVRRLVEWAKGEAQVKASGGIRSLQAARAMLDAGATRIGTSSSVSIVQEALR